MPTFTRTSARSQGSRRQTSWSATTGWSKRFTPWRRPTALTSSSRAATEPTHTVVITFGDRVRVHTVAALPADVKTEALWPLSATGSTTLHDAIVVAAQLGRADARPALVLLFTDGTDTASWSAAGTVLDALRRSSVVVVAVGAGLVDAGLTPADSWFFRAPSWLSPTPGDTLRFMHLLADTTAGEFVRVERRADLADVFAGVLQRYRQRYLLSFTPHPDNPRGWHRLEVRLREKEGTVAARPGYMVP